MMLQGQGMIKRKFETRHHYPRLKINIHVTSQKNLDQFLI